MLPSGYTCVRHTPHVASEKEGGREIKTESERGGRRGGEREREREMQKLREKEIERERKNEKERVDEAKKKRLRPGIQGQCQGENERVCA